MNRREFISYTSAGFVAIMASSCTQTGSGAWKCAVPKYKKTSYKFRPYRPGQTLGKVMWVTPTDGAYLHTFYDICPFSPSQRYLAVTKFPFEDREPKLGDIADVCIIDLENETIETVYATKGWGVQLGAQLEWGTTDRYIYTNDVIGSEAVCVRIDLETKEVKAFAGPKYHMAPDESSVIGFPLDLINATQHGYGVPLDADKSPRKYTGAPSNEGLWRTDLKTNKKQLLVSLKDIYDNIPDSEKSYYDGGTFYFFHSKFNDQNTRISLVVRCLFPDKKGGPNAQLFTFNTDGSNILRAVPRDLWALGVPFAGVHPNWHPDGERIIMNLSPDGKDRRFCQFKYDGSDFKILSKTKLGSGHMRVDPESHYLIADAYQVEPFTNEHDETPIRLLDLRKDEERTVCMIFTGGKEARETLRIDPHVVWDRKYKKVCFNGSLEKRQRQVLIADLSDVL